MSTISTGRATMLALAILLLGTATTNAKQPHLLEPVTVTAQKKEENVQDIPASISVLSGEYTKEARIQSVDQLSQRIPNLTVFSSGASHINFPTLRGMRSETHSNVSSVVMYVDDVPVSSNMGYIAQLYDLERIEVLRGPQGPLYGRNSVGGVINVVTRKPGNETKASITLEGGTGAMVRGVASASGPLVEDTLSLGGTIQYYQRNGLVHNDYDDKNIDDRKNYSGRASVLFTPNRDLEILLLLNGTQFDEGSFGYYLYPGKEKRHVNTDHKNRNNTSVDQEALRIKYTINDNWSLTSVTSRRFDDVDQFTDFDFSTTPGFEIKRLDEYLSINQEMRINYEADGLTALAGVAFDHTDRTIDSRFRATGNSLKSRHITNTYSVFGNVRVPLSDKWAAIGGIRADQYIIDFDNATTSFKDKASWTNYSPRLSLEYAATPQNLLYASLSKGFRAGGYNSYTAPNGSEKYDEENVWATEIGSKNTFWDNRARINAATFVYRIINTQVEQFVSAGGHPMPFTSNVGDTTAYGLDLEAQVMLTPGWEVFGSVGYTHLRFGDFTDAKGNHKGNHMPYVPEYTCSLGSQYRHSSGFMVRGELLGVSKTYLDSENIGYIPAHAIANLKVGWESEATDIYLFADNILNSRPDHQAAFGGGFSVATPGISVGLSLTQRF